MGEVQADTDRQAYSPWRFCIAPMMQYTDRHFRYFARLLTRRARLYTEMVVADAILHGNRDRFLACAAEESPVALQLGGCDPDKLARAAAIGVTYGYDEINLNVGCPSSRVKSGRFGAALMAEPALVADCVVAMREAVDVPVTVKTRIGIDRQEEFARFADFIDIVHAAGCNVFIVHARKAWLDGLSPRENREIPPLRYDWVHRIKRRLPALTFIINGGLTTLDAVAAQLHACDGAMIGRAACDNPYLLSDVDRALFADTHQAPERAEVFTRYLAYAAQQSASGTPLRHLAKPLHHLYQGEPGAREWRRHLGTHCNRAGASIDALRAAIDHVSDDSGARSLTLRRQVAVPSPIRTTAASLET